MEIVERKLTKLNSLFFSLYPFLEKRKNIKLTFKLTLWSNLIKKIISPRVFSSFMVPTYKLFSFRLLWSHFLSLHNVIVLKTFHSMFLFSLSHPPGECLKVSVNVKLFQDEMKFHNKAQWWVSVCVCVGNNWKYFLQFHSHQFFSFSTQPQSEQNAG